MKVIVAGSRNFNDYVTLSKVLDMALDTIKDKSKIVIVSGKAKGADSLGERYANDKGYKIKEFPADWDAHGKSAGYIRNEEMAKYSDALIAFWDGTSRGTKHMVDLANKHKLQVRVVNFS